MRAIWKGAISFGLVNIPIALYSRARSEELKFRLLRAKDLSPVNYKRVAEADGKEVPWDQIVKGYEHEKGQFVVLKGGSFQRVDIEATQTVNITTFVKLEEVNRSSFTTVLHGAAKRRRQSLRAACAKRSVTAGRLRSRKCHQNPPASRRGKAQEKGLMLEVMHFARRIDRRR
jgi:DNA end-binding protein Ku